METSVVTEMGVILNSPSDGFIVVGNIFTAKVNDTGMPTGGLIGNNMSDDINYCYGAFKAPKPYIKMRCYSKLELLEVLGFTADELLDFACKIRG